jgi:hypothetical protein
MRVFRLSGSTAVSEEDAMSKELRAVEWYRECIRQKQRRATSLTIDVDLQSMDNGDAASLLRTIERLDSAILVLEEANAIVRNVGEEMMDDLSHSMAPMDFALASAEAEIQMAEAAARDALLFFE